MALSSGSHPAFRLLAARGSQWSAVQVGSIFIINLVKRDFKSQATRFLRWRNRNGQESESHRT